MVGKKSGKALLREEGLERTDNNMEQSSWPVIQPINQKNYYVDFLKRDEQFLAVRTQQDEARLRMIKNAKDRDRALAHGGKVNEDGDVDMDEDDEEEEDEISAGNRTIVIHPGSENLRIGLASDLLPKTVPMVIARRAQMSEMEEDDGEPAPKRRKLDSGLVEPVPEKRFGEAFAAKFVAASNELKVRMRMNKLKVLPQSRDMVVSYNRRATYETINEHNDTMHIDWTDVSKEPTYVAGNAALRIPDESKPRYKLHWPIRHGWVNEKDYDSIRNLYNDIGLIIEDSVRTELKLEIRTRKDWAQYNCVIVIPDYYERTYVTHLLDLAIQDLGLARVCFIQESLAASFGAGYTTTCVVDIGAQKTSVCCVEDGMVIENSRVNLKFGGHDVTDQFVKMIIYNHFPYADVNLKRRYDWLLANELKKKHSTIVEPDISVQLYDFHLRAPRQDTRKYSFKIYDEVALPSLTLFRPELFDHKGKLDGRRRLISKSYDTYDGKANDPTSTAQGEILKALVPPEPVPEALKPRPNGINGLVRDETDSRRPSIARIQELENGTPTPSGASSPIRRATPPIDNGTPRHTENGTPMPGDDSLLRPGGDDTMMDTTEHHYPTPQQRDPFYLERRDDILPIYPLAHAITSSINHAARGSPAKTKDLYNSLLLVGGASKTAGMGAHMEITLQGILAETGYSREVVVSRPPRELDPEVVTWKGGAVFGRMSKTNDSWVTPFLYERLGERVLASKLMWAW
ncbi:actin-like protein arp8 [Lithohypha guttulata]|uniref:Actin-like protein arp8 n=1 Tax=Lithohypha guttulata TaxID=1690604 RepID=A0AAN7Y7E1_9EURO|nr:actin-like protein arp8 [Lithohypha guttulata]